MFISELSPILKEFLQQPIAFGGGFFSGLLRLNLADEPVRSWLDRQTGSTSTIPESGTNNGKSSGPQSIAIE